jgi:hypothetical protein
LTLLVGMVLAGQLFHFKYNTTHVHYRDQVAEAMKEIFTVDIESHQIHKYFHNVQLVEVKAV